MLPPKEIYRQLDRLIALSLAKSRGPLPPCKAGCFWCCKEPVYAYLSEVRYLLANLNQKQRDAIAARLRPTLTEFIQNPISQDHMPNAFNYRQLNLWCPLLVDGRCSVYDRRPASCRVHLAYESSDGCQHDHLRPHQKFATFPGLEQIFGKRYIENMRDGDLEIADNLLVLLGRELLGEDHPTGSRTEFRRTGATIEIKEYESNDTKPI